MLHGLRQYLSRQDLHWRIEPVRLLLVVQQLSLVFVLRYAHGCGLDRFVPSTVRLSNGEVAVVGVGKKWGDGVVVTLPRRLNASRHHSLGKSDTGKPRRTYPSASRSHMLCFLFGPCSDLCYAPRTGSNTYTAKARAVQITTFHSSSRSFLPTNTFFFFTVPCANLIY